MRPGSSRIETRPRTERPPQVRCAQLEPGDIRKKISALSDYIVFGSVVARRPTALPAGRASPQLGGTSGSTLWTTSASWAPSCAPTSSLSQWTRPTRKNTTTRPTRKTFPRPVPRHLSRRWRWGSTPQWAAGGRLPLPARRKVRSSRDSPNPAPKVPQSGVPATHSQHPPRLSGAAAALETGCACAGSIAYVHGLAGAVFAASSNLSTTRRGRLCKVSRARPYSRPRTRSAMGPALNSRPCRRCCRCAVRASRVGHPRLSPPPFATLRRSWGRRSAAAACRAGHPWRAAEGPSWPFSGCCGRGTLAPATDEGCAGCGSVGGVRRAHAGPSAAAAAAGTPPRGRCMQAP